MLLLLVLVPGMLIAQYFVCVGLSKNGNKSVLLTCWNLGRLCVCVCVQQRITNCLLDIFVFVVHDRLRCVLVVADGVGGCCSLSYYLDDSFKMDATAGVGEASHHSFVEWF
jgi:hypothetical protein